MKSADTDFACVARKHSMDVVNKLWGFCNTLRHDGIDYGDYIEQLTYLLFLKMADENIHPHQSLSG
jgi:type I restriction-modification system DNA methylase subunit